MQTKLRFSGKAKHVFRYLALLARYRPAATIRDP